MEAVETLEQTPEPLFQNANADIRQRVMAEARLATVQVRHLWDNECDMADVGISTNVDASESDLFEQSVEKRRWAS